LSLTIIILLVIFSLYLYDNIVSVKISWFTICNIMRSIYTSGALSRQIRFVRTHTNAVWENEKNKCFISYVHTLLHKTECWTTFQAFTWINLRNYLVTFRTSET
jgi:hypothetical protein